MPKSAKSSPMPSASEPNSFHTLIAIMTVLLVVAGAAITSMMSYQISMLHAEIAEVRYSIAKLQTTLVARTPSAGMMQGAEPVRTESMRDAMEKAVDGYDSGTMMQVTPY